MAYIVVTGKNTIWHTRFIKHLICIICILPFRNQWFIIDDVTIMEHVLDVHSFSVIQYPVMNIQLILIKSINILIWITFIVFVVVLCIRFYRKGEVIVLTCCIVYVIGCIRTLFTFRILGWCIPFTILYHDSDFAINDMIRKINICYQCHLFTINTLFSFCFFIAVCYSVIDIHLCLGIIGCTTPDCFNACCITDVIRHCDFKFFKWEAIIFCWCTFKRIDCTTCICSTWF